MGQQRNNLMRHPAAVRFRVYSLHYEGKTVAEINADPAVAESVRLTGYRLHGNTLTAAFRRSNAEFQRYVASQERVLASHEAERITQHVIANAGALDTVTDVARYELAKEIGELIRSGPGIVGTGDDAEAEDPVERVERLTRALATIGKSEVDKYKKDIARLEAENDKLRRQIADLLAAGSAQRGGLSPETIKKIEEQSGLL